MVWLKRADENTIVKDDFLYCISCLIMYGTPKNKIHHCAIIVYLPGFSDSNIIGLYSADEVAVLLGIIKKTSHIY